MSPFGGRLLARAPAAFALAALAFAPSRTLYAQTPSAAPPPVAGNHAGSPPDVPPGYLPDDPRELPRSQASGLGVVFDDLGVDDLCIGFAELLEMPAPGALGGPLPSLSPRAMIAFAAGRVAFRSAFTPGDGLGPHFNEAACADCHAHPVVGGIGTLPEHVIHVMEPPDLPGETVGLRRQALPGFPLEQADGRRGRRRTPPLFGLGLLDALPDEVLLAHADSEDRDGDGVRGRLNQKGRGGAIRSARFGAKSHEWNLWRFIGGAMRDEMGMTNPAAAGPQGDADAVADPEVDHATMRRIDAFVRGLAPPPRAVPDATAQRGEVLFDGIGCTACHRAALGGVQGVYSDLLLHDLGAKLDAGLDDGPAKARFWRTPPLWGLRHRPRLLHDERVKTPADAIALHGGEAEGARKRFAALPAESRRAILAFLATL